MMERDEKGGPKIDPFSIDFMTTLLNEKSTEKI